MITCQTYHGKAIGSGAALGKLCSYFHSVRVIDEEKDFDLSEEREKLTAAIGQAGEQLRIRYESAKETLGEEDAAIFSVHLMMLEDEELKDRSEEIIRAGHSAAYAVTEAGKSIADQLEAMQDGYMKARAADVLDVSRRICDLLTGRSDCLPELTEPVILVSDDLSPSEAVRLDREKVLALVLSEGSESAHTAILLRSMGIPALIQTGVQAEDVADGADCAVDTTSGLFVIEPDRATAERCREEMRNTQQEKRALQAWIGKQDRTADGRPIKLYCNIGSAKELEAVKLNDGRGIGLYRSEFLYLESDSLPSEERQFAEYRSLAESGIPVIVRTMDVGADKQVDYLGQGFEDNPALGYRSVRICRDRPEILKTQLRAIYRAAVYGDLSVMFPMIISVQEVKWAKMIAGEAAASLAEDGIEYKANIPLGIMIETPAAALTADLLAPEVDFFSIGTNDLTQYTLAVDRQNERVSNLYAPDHPALLRLIEQIVKAAHIHGKWVGICGEAARDLQLTPFFLAVGIDELSVSPNYILPMRRAIAELDTRTVDILQMMQKNDPEP